MFFLNLTNNSWTENTENTTKTLVWISLSVFANFRFQLNFCKKGLPQVFFFQLLTATSENSSTRLEKRLENSKSAKFESDLLKKNLKYSPAKWRNFTEVCMLRGTFHGMWNSSKGLFTWRWGPQIGEVTCGGSPHLSCKRDQIKMRDYMDRWITHQSRLPHLPGVTQLLVIRP